MGIPTLHAKILFYSRTLGVSFDRTLTLGRQNLYVSKNDIRLYLTKFTNDDLVKQSRMADDFTYTLSFEGERNGQKVSEVTCLAKEDAAVVWGKVVVEVRSDDLLPISTKYYDEDMELSRIMTFSEIRLFGKRKLPAVMTIKPQDKPNESTQVRYEDVDFDASVADSLFSRRNLER